MTTEYSRSINDWADEKWEFVGRNLEMSKKGEWDDDNQDGLNEDDFYPVMLYAYPLSDCPSDTQIRLIHKKTNCTVVKDTDTEEYYLALCGGGMDLSQDIALAYIIATGYIPIALVFEVCKQPELSVHGNDWLKVARRCKKELKFNMDNSKEAIKMWNKNIKEFKIKQKERKAKTLTTNQ